MDMKLRQAWNGYIKITGLRFNWINQELVPVVDKISKPQMAMTVTQASNGPNKNDRTVWAKQNKQNNMA